MGKRLKLLGFLLLDYFLMLLAVFKFKFHSHRGKELLLSVKALSNLIVPRKIFAEPLVMEWSQLDKASYASQMFSNSPTFKNLYTFL